jgi:hypothetical protein
MAGPGVDPDEVELEVKTGAAEQPEITSADDTNNNPEVRRTTRAPFDECVTVKSDFLRWGRQELMKE